MLAREAGRHLPIVNHSARNCGRLSIKYPGVAMFRRAVAVAVLLVLAAPVAPVIAQTAAAVSVKVNMARILRISAPAATVIIGNPGVADVTIQDPQTLVLTGKSFGQTNLIVLDGMGNPIADTLIDVIQDQASTVTVYLAEKRTSLSCNPVCQPVVMLGDDLAYTSAATASSTAVSGLAAAQ
jgi:Flp pilus assembly secretin CpaC